MTDEVEQEFAAVVAEARLLANLHGDADLNQGHIMSVIMVRVIEQGPANATKEEIAEGVRRRMQRYGFDPDRPWLRRRSHEHDL